jgi:hypothetical protein
MLVVKLNFASVDAVDLHDGAIGSVWDTGGAMPRQRHLEPDSISNLECQWATSQLSLPPLPALGGCEAGHSSAFMTPGS